jgi:hypothetical protein
MDSAGLDSLQGHEIFVFSKMYILALRPIHVWQITFKMRIHVLYNKALSFQYKDILLVYVLCPLGCTGTVIFTCNSATFAFLIQNNGILQGCR